MLRRIGLAAATAFGIVTGLLDISPITFERPPGMPARAIWRWLLFSRSLSMASERLWAAVRCLICLDSRSRT